MCFVYVFLLDGGNFQFKVIVSKHASYVLDVIHPLILKRFYYFRTIFLDHEIPLFAYKTKCLLFIKRYLIEVQWRIYASTSELFHH